MEAGATDPQLVLKATPPRVPKTLLARPRLSISGPEFADKSIIVIQAPSGFGKTSLLAQWRREALRSGAVAAWLTLDERDDGSRLVHGLAVAMSMASGRPGFGQAYARKTKPGEGDLEALTNWLAEVAYMAAEVVLILDDVSSAPKATLETSLMYLFRNAPANLKIVLGARKPISLPVADLLAHGQLAYLDADALRFRLEETLAVITARFGSRADSDACVRLHELTEGWPLGLQLAVATIEKSPSLSEAIAEFSVHTGDIQRYFVASLVDHLPPALAQFLIRISFVDALRPDLCQAITGRADAADLLQGLQDATPIFLGGVDSDWLRIHPLAREFLRDRFAAQPAEERRLAHERAARWLAEHQMFEAAARQALQAGQDSLAYEFVAHCLHDVLETGQVARVSEWAARLPAAEIEKSPRLRLAIAWTLALSERHAEAASLVESLLDDPASDLAVHCESAEICAAAAFFADDIEGIERILSPWFGSLASQPVLVRTVGTNLMAILAIYRGMPEQARHYYQQLPPDSAAMAGGYTRGWSDWLVGLSYLWQGQVVVAEEALRASLFRAEEECGRRGPIAVMMASSLAAVLWERDKTAEMAALLADRLDVLERLASPDAMINGYLSAARVAALGGLERRAFDLLDNLHALGEVRSLPRLCVASLAEQIRMHALRSHREACAALTVRLDNLTTREAFARWGLLGPLVQLRAGLARAYSAVVVQDWQRVLAELNPISAIAENLRRSRDGIQIRLLRALALKSCGEDGRALLTEALSMAETLGLERMLVDTHPDLVNWARRVRGEGNAAAAPGLRRTQEERAIAEPRLPVNTHVFPSALLTPKEREVLHLLAGNLSNKQIALALGVGDETVKWHLKNLFGKLDAGNRKHLLDRARLLGVLDTVA